MTEENIVETQVENQDSQNTDQELDLELDTETTDEVVETEQVEATDEAKAETPDKDAEIAKLKEQNAKLYARLKKQPEVKKSPAVKGDNSEGNIELIEFFAKGNSREDYEKLKVIMKGTGLSMSEAMSDPLYQSYKEKKAREIRDEKAQIGASKASSPSNDYGIKPNMTRDEHKEVWKKLNSR